MGRGRWCDLAACAGSRAHPLRSRAQVPAGSVLALGGLDQAILKSATLASSPLCRPLAPMLFQSAPIVRVAGEAAARSTP